jgi:glucokinase
MLHMSTRRRVVSIGIDLGGTELKIVAIGDDGELLSRRRVSTDATSPRQVLIERIATLVAEIRAEISATSPETMVVAVGLAVPGVIDAPSGHVEFTVALAEDWNGFAAVAALKAALSLPAVLINDAQAATFGELTDGGGRGYRDFVCVTVGTGIGGGLVLGGRLYAGSRGMSGVLGHTTVLPDGPLCACGNRGCLEMVASGAAITRAAKTRLTGDIGASSCSDSYTPRTVAEAAIAGDAVAQEIYAETGRYLGVALGNVVCTLNPQAIVVGGGVSQAGELLLAPMREEIVRRTSVFSVERGGVDILLSPLGSDAGAIGAARWAAKQRQGATAT